MAKKKLNFPNVLTLTRLILSPLMLPFLLVYLLPFNILWINGALAALFVMFGLTDFFDGYFARRYKQETMLGRLLDPLADKFLVVSVLISLLVVHKIFFYWVIVLIAREIFVMGLRIIALEHELAIHVSFTAKLKTFFQLFYVTVAILNPYQALGFCGPAACWNLLETLLLAITLFFSLSSARSYFVNFLAAFKKKQEFENHHRKEEGA